jgi:glycine/D-amino acid oxidase-like deaminating enzyme
MLAPSVERADGADGAASTLALAARDRYPGYLDWLRERSGITVPLNRLGILQVALSAAGVKGLRKGANPGSHWLDRAELTALEPALSHALGALFSPHDGCVDIVALLHALDTVLARAPLVRRIAARVRAATSNEESVTVITADGTRYSAGHAVIAAGAWSGEIEGAPLAAVVEPVRGQLVSYAAAPCRHTLYGPRGYLVPRGSSTIAGSTMERVGFTPGTTREGVARVRSAAEEICPSLAAAQPASAWSGFRPVTPDMLPLVGPDPRAPRIVYATGHSRNGVLLAPLTAEIVANLVFEDVLNFDPARYRPDRFQDTLTVQCRLPSSGTPP